MISTDKKKKSDFAGRESDGDDCEVSSAMDQDPRSEWLGLLSTNPHATYTDKIKAVIGGTRPPTLVIPSALDMPPIDLLEPCAPSYDPIPRLPRDRPSEGWVSQIVYFDDRLYDGTHSRVKPPVPFDYFSARPGFADFVRSSPLPPLPSLAPLGLALCQESTPSFYSAFESGNLLQATHVAPCEFDLVLRADVNTLGHCQWFYFAVTVPSSCLDPHRTYRFNIVNLSKESSLYSQGMRPLLFDCSRPAEGFKRTGLGIRYVRNGMVKPSAPGCKGAPENYMTLSFTVQFPASGSTFLLAHSYPYSYSDHRRHTESILADSQRAEVCRVAVLCHSIGGRQCDMLTVTDFSAPAHEMAGKGGVVFTARVHPGESTASWLMKGTIDYLTGSSASAKALRKAFVFKIIPMLNPDGVALGNNRCNLAGVDLNRQYRDPDPLAHPTVHALKAMLRGFRSQREVVLYMDMHNHSQKKWAFFYGVSEGGKGKRKAKAAYARQVKEYVRRISSSQGGRHYFSFQESSFTVHKSREGTGRVVVSRGLAVPFSYTIEVSFCGPTHGSLAGCHFNVRALVDMGRFVLQGLLSADDSAAFDVSETSATFINPTNSPAITGYSGASTAALESLRREWPGSSYFKDAPKMASFLVDVAPKVKSKLSSRKQSDVPKQLKAVVPIPGIKAESTSERVSSLKPRGNLVPFESRASISTSLAAAENRWRPVTVSTAQLLMDISGQASHTVISESDWPVGTTTMSPARTTASPGGPEEPATYSDALPTAAKSVGYYWSALAEPSATSPIPKSQARLEYFRTDGTRVAYVPTAAESRVTLRTLGASRSSSSLADLPGEMAMSKPGPRRDKSIHGVAWLMGGDVMPSQARQLPILRR